MKRFRPIKSLSGAGLRLAPPGSSVDDVMSDGVVLRQSQRKSVRAVVAENAVVLFSKKDCCMGHVIRRLLLSLGNNPAIYEVSEEDEGDTIRELMALDDNNNNNKDKLQFPTVVIGGTLFGGLDRVMGCHISGELVPILRHGCALCL